ncbi:hypothetical protein F5Y15DRAFT_52970 [Xylariaceae sp. FL0016]|nr:hypothetical protein F5Y15DRAFT_52970 [Xylariaceae sp. FL0016]
MQANQANSGPLEDRLRNLILTNVDQNDSRPSTVDGPPSVKTQAEPENIPSAPKTGRKRPNQAQRRQMNAQLSIPIDTRPPPPSQYSRSHHQNQQIPQSQFTQQHNQHQQQHHAPFQTSSGARASDAQGRTAMNRSQAHTQQRYHNGGRGQTYGPSNTHNAMDWRYSQARPPDNFTRGVNVVSADAFTARGQPPHQSSLYAPGPGYRRSYSFTPESISNQSHLLDGLCETIVMAAEIAPAEIAEKERFRSLVEDICRFTISRHEIDVHGNLEFQPASVLLRCFGSLASGFATKAADMDLGLLTPMSRTSPDSPDSHIPRLIERALLDAGFGARLLTKTRIPIIKLCEKPTAGLRQALLDERLKWERGLQEDDHVAEDDILAEKNFALHASTPGTNESQFNSITRESASRSATDNANENTIEGRLSTWKQGDKQSLSNYFGHTKRILRWSGGREIAHSIKSEFSEEEYQLLDAVALAFIRGLRDTRVRDRILSYPSFGDAPSFRNRRSLIGAHLLVEGEKLLILWENRPDDVINPELDQLHQRSIHWWKNLQQTKSFGVDPLSFNRELQTGLDSLHQIPSIQLMTLRQEQHETPTQYYNRAVQISVRLQSPSYTSPNAEGFFQVVSQIIKQYIEGIREDHIRKAVHDFTTTHKIRYLRTVARKHRSIYLATDFERALDGGNYQEDDTSAIKEYVSLLRQDLVNIAMPSDEAVDYVVPVSESQFTLLEKIQNLPDPSKLAPNQPKDRYHDGLEFPKSGVGVHCDINFAADLALHNTALLRCYASTDLRVRPMVLFVKHWAKARGINSPYRGTLSSYGYVLMVLHYLVNIVEPFVCPNLQELAANETRDGITLCKGRDVRFWRDEHMIRELASQGRLNQNRDTLGVLLRGFFEYYAHGSLMSTISKTGFDWGRDVLSLRARGGLLSKAEKGWTGAKTVMQVKTGASFSSAETKTSERQVQGTSDIGICSDDRQPMVAAPTDTPLSPGLVLTSSGSTESVAKPKEMKEVRYRYLFAIEDPFELDHNVARTVTHNGIVAIRDEFRRAWRIIRSAGKTGHASEDLLEDDKLSTEAAGKKEFLDLLSEIHGPARLWRSTPT